MSESFEAYQAERARLTELVLEHGTKTTKRFFNLDSAAYRDGALPARTKELLGLVASAVLRCDDCIRYHLDQAVAGGWSDEEIREALDVALIVGGSITIPHVRRAYGDLEGLRATADE
ncbi:MAG: carboxymuconolactone decarboxylase family protein [Planctomycetes bacterium]|nr:carboxymuconolactone decarboxylase family protein [Planctomycetota bacterium]